MSISVIYHATCTFLYVSDCTVHVHYIYMYVYDYPDFHQVGSFIPFAVLDFYSNKIKFCLIFQH